MQVAILIDGCFFEKGFRKVVERYPEADDVLKVCRKTMDMPEFSSDQLLKIYYYDCYPYSGAIKNPLTGEVVSFAMTEVYRRKNSFLQDIKNLSGVSFRAGVLSNDGWKIPFSRINKLIRKTASGESLCAEDLVINLSKKQLEIKIGMDVASLCAKRRIGKLVLMTGDSGFAPAIKLARKEGLTVYLVYFDQNTHEELKGYCDAALGIDPRVVTAVKSER